MKLKLVVAAVGLAFSIPAMADSGGVYQSGNDNYANVEQTSSGAGASVYQSGDRNRVGFDYRPYGYDYQYPGITQYQVNWGYASVQQQSYNLVMPGKRSLPKRLSPRVIRSVGIGASLQQQRYDL